MNKRTRLINEIADLILHKLNESESKDQTPLSNSGVIAADYLLTGGPGVVLSTDYFIQALSGAFLKAGKDIDKIRREYIQKIGNLGDLKTSLEKPFFKSMVSDIKKTVIKTYGSDSGIEKIFDTILKYPTGLPVRLGQDIASELEDLNF